MKTKRNDPCPCGSGKKYKKCCMGNPDEIMKEFKEDVHDLLAGREFSSLEEAQAVLEAYSWQKNSAPQEHFHGLSPDQMYNFLHHPFDSSELATFPSVLQTEPESPAAFLLSLLFEGLEKEGLKLTEKGNLGQKFCQQARERYVLRFPDLKWAHLPIRSEINFADLNTVRITAQLAGLTRKCKGKLLLTAKARKAWEKHGLREVYPMLLRAYIEKFNWAYRDGYQDMTLIQQSFLFTLYLLQKYGKQWRSCSFYSENFQLAFPVFLAEIKPEIYGEPEKILNDGYILRALERFAQFFGLIEIENGMEWQKDNKNRLQATSLLAEVVQFHF